MVEMGDEDGMVKGVKRNYEKGIEDVRSVID